MLSHLIPERHGRTDRRTDIIAISISRVSVLTPVTIFNMVAVRHLKFKKKFLFVYVTVIDLQICCCVPNFIKIR